MPEEPSDEPEGVVNAGPAEEVQADARLRRYAGAVRADEEARQGTDLRHPEAPGFASPLRLPPGDGGCAEVVGGTERAFLRSSHAPPGDDDRGPSVRLRRLRRGDPGGELR